MTMRHIFPWEENGKCMYDLHACTTFKKQGYTMSMDSYEPGVIQNPFLKNILMKLYKGTS